MSAINVKGACAIITGAGSGISLAYAKQLHVRGCRVLIADIGLRPEAEDFIKSANQNGGQPKVVFVKTDVSDWSHLENLFDVAATELGSTPDIVCAGAGVYEPPQSGFWADSDPASHYKIIDIDLLHPIKLTRIAVRRALKAQKPACIVHVSSLACQTASLVTPLYSVSKHGVTAFVRGQAGLESLCQIRVVCVAPGSVRTPLMLEDSRVRHWLDPKQDYMLDPTVVANAMLALTENKDNKYPGGSILEVTDDEEHQWRLVPLYNNPGPQGRATGASNKDAALEQIKEILREESEMAATL